MPEPRSTDITAQVESFLNGLSDYPAQPFRAIADAMTVLEEDVIKMDPDYDEFVPLFGRHLKELRPLGTDVRILFTFGPDRTLVLLYAGDKEGSWTRWYASAIPEAARLYREYLEETGQA